MTLYEKYLQRAAEAFRKRELRAMTDEALFAALNDALNRLEANCLPPQLRWRQMDIDSEWGEVDA